MSNKFICPYCGAPVRVNTKGHGVGPYKYTKQAQCTYHSCQARGPLAPDKEAAKIIFTKRLPADE